MCGGNSQLLRVGPFIIARATTSGCFFHQPDDSADGVVAGVGRDTHAQESDGVQRSRHNAPAGPARDGMLSPVTGLSSTLD
jgi:hypothetical protein